MLEPGITSGFPYCLAQGTAAEPTRVVAEASGALCYLVT